MKLEKLNPHKGDTFKVLFDKCNNNFKYLEDMIKDSSVNLRYQRVELKDTGSLIKLKSSYQMNSNAIELYIDGVRQHPSNFIEVNPTTIQVLDIRDLNQVADIYYRESFVVDNSRRSDELAPIYTLSQVLTVSYFENSLKELKVNQKLIVPSSGFLWRIIVHPKYPSTAGLMNISVKGGSYTIPLYNDNKPSDIYEYNTESNSIIINTFNTDIYKNFSTGDTLNIEFNMEKPIYPLQNQFEITYVIKQSIQEVGK